MLQGLPGQPWLAQKCESFLPFTCSFNGEDCSVVCDQPDQYGQELGLQRSSGNGAYIIGLKDPGRALRDLAGGEAASWRRADSVTVLPATVVEGMLRVSELSLVENRLEESVQKQVWVFLTFHMLFQ